MPRYLVEAYVPRARAGDAPAAGHDARTAAEQLSHVGRPVHYVRTTLLPNDETCFHVFESTDEDTVREVCRRAGIGSARIVPVLE
jgi:hypothetical protein